MIGAGALAAFVGLGGTLAALSRAAQQIGPMHDDNRSALQRFSSSNQEHRAQAESLSRAPSEPQT